MPPGWQNSNLRAHTTIHILMVAILQPVAQGRLIAVDRAVVLLGRSADCDAVIDGSKKISRRHCCVVQVDEDYFVRDLGSMNGVWVNGQRIKGQAPLVQGDILCVGDVEFTFHTNVRFESRSNSEPTADEEIATDENSVPDDSGGVSLDDVIPLDQLDSEEVIEVLHTDIDLDPPLTDTNEVEVIDAPIIDVPVLDKSSVTPDLSHLDPPIRVKKRPEDSSEEDVAE